MHVSYITMHNVNLGSFEFDVLSIIYFNYMSEKITYQACHSISTL